MKNEEEIEKTMASLKDAMPKSPKDEFLILQVQYNTLEWVLDKKEEVKDE